MCRFWAYGALRPEGERTLPGWSLGQMIAERQEALGWGKAVVERLAADLRAEFPDMTGFSSRNLWEIKRFYETYTAASEKLQQLVAEIPWGHNILIMQLNWATAFVSSAVNTASPWATMSIFLICCFTIAS